MSDEILSVAYASGSWLIFLFLCGHLIFCHGCHGEDVDDELAIPPPTKVSRDAQRSAKR